MWTERSYEAELLDGGDFNRNELFRNLRELELVNRWLGGHAASVKLMKSCLQQDFRPDIIIDIGCGGGDSLEVLERKFAHLLPGARWVGCDLNPLCLEFAEQFHPGKNLLYSCSDFRNIIIPEGSVVLFHASLFFHHFREDEITGFLRFARGIGAAVIINDLQRHPLAWAGIKILSALPGCSRLFRNDAPLSVKRGFLTSEWKSILEKSGYHKASLRRARAFRHILCLAPDFPE